MRQISFLPPQSTKQSDNNNKIVQSRIRAHLAQHRQQLDAKKKHQAAEAYWKRVEEERSRDESRTPPSATQAPASPHSILKKGNSDPFNAYAVTITPRLNQILSFYVNNFLPTYYNIVLVPSPSTQAILRYRHVEAKDDYDFTLSVLQEKSAAHGFFFSYGAIMTSLSPDPALRLELMNIKSLAVKALQIQIKKFGDDDPRTLDAVLLLLTAAVFAGDHAEATIHGTNLRRIMTLKTTRHGPKAIDIGHMFQALWLNLSLSATFLTPTLLDVDVWVPNILKSLLDPQETGMTLSTSDAISCTKLDPALCRPLQALFHDCRRFLWQYWNLPAQSTNMTESAKLFQHLYSDFFVYSCRTVNRLVSVRGRANNPNHLQSPAYVPSEIFYWHIEHTLTATLLVLLSASTATILQAGRALVMATQMLLSRLEAAVAPALATCLSSSMRDRPISVSSMDPRDFLNRALLWALAIGAMVERLPKQSLAHVMPNSTWFTDNFGILVMQKQIHDIEQVKRILRGFIYSEDMLSDEFWHSLYAGRGWPVVMSRQASESPNIYAPYPSPVSDEVT